MTDRDSRRRNAPSIVPKLILTLSTCFLLLSSNAWAGESKFVVSHVVPLSQDNIRHTYELNVLELALKKTLQTHGPYEITLVPASSRARILRDLEVNQHTNFVYTFGYKKTFFDSGKLDYARFPVYLGALGYRVCFASPETEEKANMVTTFDQLKQFRFGLGQGWSDVEVLRHNGLRVIEAPQNQRLARMTASNKVDLFCRGVNEFLDERKTIPALKELGSARHFALYYPHPRFFLTNAKNTLLIERLEAGLRVAHADGSLLSLWNTTHGDSVKSVKLSERLLFRLENPHTASLDFNIEPFLFPLKLH